MTSAYVSGVDAARARAVAKELREYGYAIESTWHEYRHEKDPSAISTAVERSTEAGAIGAAVDHADVLVLPADAGGGRHAAIAHMEAGMAIGKYRTVIVEERSHTLLWHPCVRLRRGDESWAAALRRNGY